MTVETLVSRRTVDTMTVEEVKDVAEALWSLPTLQATDRYAEIAKLFQETHEERVGALQLKREKQEAVLDAMIENPTESLKGEFEQLMLLYAERTVYAELRNGSRIASFCTQNHETHEPDYTFKLKLDQVGVPTYSVTKLVETDEGVRRPLQYVLHEGRLSVTSARYDVKGAPYTEVFEGEDADEQLGRLFHDTIKASGLQLKRGADERDEHDVWAKARMLDEYQGVQIIDGFQTDEVVL